ncbi:alcohol dehydrogenase catalytic domain-containing protein [Spirosoma arcticum]
MRAIVIHRFGDTSVFEQVELPRPVPAPHELQVRVKATSVNPVDYKIRSGALPGLAPEFPAVLHGDVVSTIRNWSINGLPGISLPF